jgi:hypothetical protein
MNLVRLTLSRPWRHCYADRGKRLITERAELEMCSMRNCDAHTWVKMMQRFPKTIHAVTAAGFELKLVLFLLNASNQWLRHLLADCSCGYGGEARLRGLEPLPQFHSGSI